MKKTTEDTRERVKVEGCFKGGNKGRKSEELLMMRTPNVSTSRGLLSSPPVYL
jgi:hypothetical protein